MNSTKLFDLTGKTALITGAGRGLGRAISQGLADAGADVVLVGRKVEALEETAVAVRAQGREAQVLPADLSKPDEVEALLAHCSDTSNCIDILVNNAATSWAAPLHQYPLAGWDRVFDLNLRGLWLLTQGITDGMRQRDGGSVINIASISAWLAGPDSEQPVVAYKCQQRSAPVADTRPGGEAGTRGHSRQRGGAGSVPHRHDEPHSRGTGTARSPQSADSTATIRRRRRHQGRRGLLSERCVGIHDGPHPSGRRWNSSPVSHPVEPGETEFRDPSGCSDSRRFLSRPPPTGATLPRAMDPTGSSGFP